jgi:hypothetical protein
MRLVEDMSCASASSGKLGALAVGASGTGRCAILVQYIRGGYFPRGLNFRCTFSRDPAAVKREIVSPDREAAKREGMVIYTDPYLGNAVTVILQTEPYRPAPGPAAA